MRKFRTGVIGLGFIGPIHIEALRRLGNVEVVSVATTSHAREKAEELCIDSWYEDWKTMLDQEELDTVHICTPNVYHYEMCRYALEKGIHVLCDKPLAMTSQQGMELVKLAKEKGLTAGVNFNVRFYPLIHHAREMIRNNDLGRILSVSGSYQQDWLVYDTDYSWRLESAFSGESRAVADIGSHWADSALFMTGLNVEEVFSDFAIFHPIRKKPKTAIATYSGMTVSEPMQYDEVKIDTEDYASVMMRFDNGARGFFTVNQAFQGCKNRIYFEIAGTKGSLRLDTENPNEMWFGQRDSANRIILRGPGELYPKAAGIAGLPAGHAEGFGDTFKQLFRKYYGWIAAKEEGRDLPAEFPTFEDGVNEMLLCEAIISASKTSKWQHVDHL